MTEQNDLLVLSYLVHTCNIPQKKMTRFGHFAGLSKETLPPAGSLELKLSGKKAPRVLKPCNTGYKLFCLETRANYPDAKGSDRTKLQRKDWDKLSTKDQEDYDFRCNELKEEYYKEREDLRPAVAKVKRKKKDPNRPIRPVSAFVF